MSNISAKIIQDSISTRGVRLITFELEYPRFIHSEFMTHRALSKNASSSRAIPAKTMWQNILNNRAEPVYWGKNQPGMQASEELDETEQLKAKIAWEDACSDAIDMSKHLTEDLKVHKQISNRITEPFQMIKVVASGTEWKNLLWLRNHEAAQPEFRVLASEIDKALKESESYICLPGEWHVPYIYRKRNNASRLQYYNFTDTNTEITLEQAVQISVSCCAQVSYRKSDDTLEKAKDIYNKLISSDRKHASPFEHQASVMLDSNYHFGYPSLERGVTHLRFKDKSLWSGNFKGWVQHRQLIEGESVDG